MLHKLSTFIFELNHLKRIKHEGYRLIGIQNPSSVGEHSLRAAQIAYILAIMEEHPEPEKIASMLVFHDIGECRIGDLHKVARRYCSPDEEGAVEEQTEHLGTVGEKIFALWKEVEERSTPGGIIAKDADYLEMAFQAKEYLEQGYTHASDWISNVGNALKTASAKKLWEEMQHIHSSSWWEGLKKLR